MTSNKNVLKVLNGYVKLTPNEKNIFVEEINKHINGASTEKRKIEEELRKGVVQEDLGPTGHNHCPCCGKG